MSTTEGRTPTAVAAAPWLAIDEVAWPGRRRAWMRSATAERIQAVVGHSLSGRPALPIPPNGAAPGRQSEATVGRLSM
ncbi:hypothetical protein C7C45_01440 [Micromonospora arborensis]|uniref:Uncharacterized protein n=1 Tax=Micromonospora arborensis TaxID=2116518 RepID=A0A318NSF5_9ACTN|nr:hypothetical protein C7C45_01440 [Micromonospora arborensis]